MKIAPSILDADFGAFQTELDSLVTADRIHLDIMDGIYVPGITFRAADLDHYHYPISTEAHLMVAKPEDFIPEFLTLGVKSITIHTETQEEADTVRLLASLKEKGVRAGICIDGYTETSTLSDTILNCADQILVMSVKAGKGGQSFLPESCKKIHMLRERGFMGEIEVDGGINLQTAQQVRDAGADIIVVGSYLMKQAPHVRAQIIEQFHQL